MKLPNAITNKFGRQVLHLQKASPKIMFVAGVAGVVGAGVLACRSTLKLSDVLDDFDKKGQLADEIFAHAAENEDVDYSEKEYNKDVMVLKVQTVLAVAKLYAPAVALTVISIGLLTSSHVVLNRRNAGLTAAYAAIDKAYGQYRERVQAELGNDDRFRYGTEVIEETVAKKDGSGTKVVKHERVAQGEPSQYGRFFDQLCDPWQTHPEYNRIFLQSQQNYANQMLQARGHVFLNEIYDMLGIDRSGAGACVGWVLGKGGDDYISFGIFDDANNENVRDFVNGREGSILLDFNVDGVIYDKI